MGKLINCQTCGQQIAAEAKVCPHCGAKNKAKKGISVGCLIVLLVIIFCVAMAMQNTASSMPDTVTSYPSSGGLQTGKPYDEMTCVFYAKKYAEKRLDVKTKLEWVGDAKVEPLPKKNHYAVDHEFTVLNVFNVAIRHHARITMEFNPDKGYRGVWLTIDGK